MAPRHVGTVSVNNDGRTALQASVLSRNFARGATEGLSVRGGRQVDHPRVVIGSVQFPIAQRKLVYDRH